MVAIDRTPEFRDVLKDAMRLQPDIRKRKTQRPASDTGKDVQLALNKEYLAEGYAVVRETPLSVLHMLNTGSCSSVTS